MELLVYLPLSSQYVFGHIRYPVTSHCLTQLRIRRQQLGQLNHSNGKRRVIEPR